MHFLRIALFCLLPCLDLNANLLELSPAYLGLTDDGLEYVLLQNPEDQTLAAILPDNAAPFEIQTIRNGNAILLGDGKSEGGIELPINKADFDELLTTTEEVLPGIPANAIAFVEKTTEGAWTADCFQLTPEGQYLSCDIQGDEWMPLTLDRSTPGYLTLAIADRVAHTAQIGYLSYRISPARTKRLDHNATLLVTPNNQGSDISIVLERFPYTAQILDTPTGLTIETPENNITLPALSAEALEGFFETSVKHYKNPYLCILLTDASPGHRMPSETAIFVSKNDRKEWLVLPVDLKTWRPPFLSIADANGREYPVPLSAILLERQTPVLMRF